MPFRLRTCSLGTRILFALLGCAVWVTGAAGDPSGDVAQAVRRLVGQLDSRELAARERAEAELIKLGPAALPFLPGVTNRAAAETGERLARVRQALEKARAARAAEASLITLRGEFPVGEVLKELGRQSGNAIVDRRDTPINDQLKLTVDFHDKPFWQALDEVLDRADLDVDSYARGGGLSIVPRAAGRVPRAQRASYAGAFRIEPVRFEEVADLRKPAGRSLKLLIEVDWEPRLRPILISQSLDAVRATAGAQPLAVDGRGEISAPLGDGPAAISLEIPLVAPPRQVAAIEQVDGELKTLLPADVEVFRFDSLSTRTTARNKPQQHKGAVTITLEDWRKSGEGWDTEVSAHFNDPNLAIDSYLLGWLVDNKVTLEHAGRESLTPTSMQQTRQTPKEVSVKYHFALSESPEGWSLVYASPTAVLEVPSRYRFTNLDLP